MVDNRYTGVGYEPPIDCVNCQRLEAEFAEVKGERDNFKKAYFNAQKGFDYWAGKYEALRARCERLEGAASYAVSELEAEWGEALTDNELQDVQPQKIYHKLKSALEPFKSIK